jgi:hypothetical protein
MPLIITQELVHYIYVLERGFKLQITHSILLTVFKLHFFGLSGRRANTRLVDLFSLVLGELVQSSVIILM